MIAELQPEPPAAHPRLYVPLLFRGQQGQGRWSLWSGYPPASAGHALWPFQLYAWGWDSATTIEQLWVYRPHRTAPERSPLLPAPAPAALWNPNDPHCPRLPAPFQSCSLGASINARVSGPLRKLVVICTTLDGATTMPPC